MQNNDQYISISQRCIKRDVVSSPYAFWLVAALFAALVMLIACKPSEEKSQINLDTGVMRIEIDGQRFDVPLRYMYSHALATHGNWPTPKKEVAKVGALNLSVLLPDFRPYYSEDDARWKVRGHGDKAEVSIAKPVGGLTAWHDWYESSLQRTSQLAAEGRFYANMPDNGGLTHYSEKTGDRYYAQDGRRLTISCDTAEPPPGFQGFYSPSCKVISNYKPGLIFEYYYALKYLPQWKEIDNGMRALFDKFEQSARASSIQAKPAGTKTSERIK